MKINSVKNYNYNFNNPVSFSSRGESNKELKNSNNNDEIHFKPRTPGQEWAVRGVLALSVLFCVNNELNRHGFWRPDDVKMREKLKTEYFEDASNLSNSSQRHHLYRLAEVDRPQFISNMNGLYHLRFSLDKGKQIDLNINLNSRNDNCISGFISNNHSHFKMFKAEFDENNPDEFKMHLRTSDNKKIIIGRKPDGTLYKIANGKKVILNRENVEKYNQYLKNLEKEDNFTKFFSNENDLWRKLQIILTMILLLNEMAYESLKRKHIKDND